MNQPNPIASDYIAYPLLGTAASEDLLFYGKRFWTAMLDYQRTIAVFISDEGAREQRRRMTIAMQSLAANKSKAANRKALRILEGEIGTILAPHVVFQSAESTYWHEREAALSNLRYMRDSVLG